MTRAVPTRETISTLYPYLKILRVYPTTTTVKVQILVSPIFYAKFNAKVKKISAIKNNVPDQRKDS